MTKDKKVLVLLISIGVAALCGGVYLVERVEKDGMFQGHANWVYLNTLFRKLLAESESKGQRQSLESQAIYARLLHNVGITCGYTDQWTDALRLLNKSLDFNMKTRAVSSESLTQSIESLGKAYYLTGQYERAKTALDFAARDWVHENGEDCKQYARCLSYSGRVHRARGQFELAEKCFEKAKAVFKKEDDRAAIAKEILLIAESAISRGDLAYARIQLDEAIKLLKIDFGDNYRSYFNDEVGFLNCLEGQLLVKTGQSEKGIQLINDGLNEACLSFGNDGVYTQEFRLALAEASLRTGNGVACLRLLKNIEKSFEKIGLPDHPYVKRIRALEREAMGHGKAIDSTTMNESSPDADTFAARLTLRSNKSKAGRAAPDPWMLPLSMLIIAWVFSGMFACAMACAAQAGRKDYSSSVWFMLGAVFNFVAYLVVSALPSRNSLTKEFGPDFAMVNDARVGVFLIEMSPLLCILGASLFYFPVPFRDVFIAVFFACAVCSILFPPIWCFAIARSKGRNQYLWTMIGLCTSVFGLTLLLLMRSTRQADTDEEEMRNTAAETVTLLASAIHIGFFISVVTMISSSWMLHLEL